VCRIIGLNDEVCSLPPPSPPSASGAFLDGPHPGF
jgi:hypothetical protein